MITYMETKVNEFLLVGVVLSNLLDVEIFLEIS